MVTKRQLGRTPIEITPIGLGCMQFAGSGLVGRNFYPPLAKDVIHDIVRTALDGGTGWFDTAEMYGNGASERALTSALHALHVAPGSVPIATKWPPLLRRASSIVRTIDARLAALQGYPIDLHQIHLPHGGLSSIRSQVEAMATLCRAGKITAVGVSNFTAKHMELASRVLGRHGIALASNQVQISLLHRNIEHDGVLETARRLGVTLIAFSPLKSGVLTGRFHDEPQQVKSLLGIRKMLGAYSTSALRRSAPLIDELRAIGKANGASAGQVALSWLITFYGDTVVAIPGASKPHHAAESAAAMDLHLTERELARLADHSR